MTRISSRLCALPFACLALTAPLHAQDGPIASPLLTTFDYGIMCYFDYGAPDDPLNFAEAMAVMADTNDFGSVEVIQTLDVPNVSGIVFGINSTLAEGESQTVTSDTIHTHPDGEAVTYAAQYLLSDIILSDVWAHDTADPQWDGSYRFVAYADGHTYYDVTFNVIPVEAYSGPFPDCVSRP